MNADAIPMTLLKLAAAPLLVLLNGFFVAAEFALVKIRGTQLDMLAARGQRRAKVARHSVKNLEAALSATQPGLTLASLGLGWVGKPVFAALLGPVFRYSQIDPEPAGGLAFAVGFTAMTFLHIVVGEPAAHRLRRLVGAGLDGGGGGQHGFRLDHAAVGTIPATGRLRELWPLGIGG